MEQYFKKPAANDQRPGFACARFSTTQRPRSEWRSIYRDLLSRAIIKLDFDVVDERLSIDSRILKLPGAGVVDSRVTAFRTMRSRAMAEGTGDYIFFLCLEGGASFSHLGRHRAVAAGEAILLSSSDPDVVERPMSRHFFLTVPKAILASMIPNIDSQLMTPMSDAGERFGLLRSYVDLLMADKALAAPDLRELAASHIHDLIAAGIGATRDSSEIANGRGVRAARMRAIKADIAENMAAGDITSEALARRHRVGPRYIRKLFEQEGVSLSQYVLGQRLALVRRMLISPRYDHLTIGVLAFDSGFGDLSTFNHAFRGRFGCTPSDVRSAAKRDRSSSTEIAGARPYGPRLDRAVA